jgi:hypothetical protein
LSPALTYSVTKPWINVEDWPDYFMLVPDTPADRAALVGDQGGFRYVLALPGTHDSSVSVACNAAPTGSPVPYDAEEYVNAIAAREDFETREPVGVTVSGLSGAMVDWRLAQDWQQTCPGGIHDGLGDSGENGWHRSLVVDRPDGGQIEVRIYTSEVGLDAFFGEAKPVVDSFEFDLTP